MWLCLRRNKTKVFSKKYLVTFAELQSTKEHQESRTSNYVKVNE